MFYPINRLDNPVFLSLFSFIFIYIIFYFLQKILFQQRLWTKIIIGMSKDVAKGFIESPQNEFVVT